MAKGQGLLLLYDYLYNATSRLVHFSPGTLFRMAWGDDGRFDCKPEAFDRYYSQFGKFYSTHLLAALETRFRSQLRVSEKLRVAIEELLREVNALVRWPELITYEELNAPSPWEDEAMMKNKSFRGFLIQDPGAVFVPKS